MPDNCEKCGAPLKQGANFCTSCGAKIAIAQVPQSNEMNKVNKKLNANQETAQTYQNTSIQHTPPRKSNMKLFGIIAAVVVAVVVIAIVLILVLGGGGFASDEGKFVGTWEADVGFGTYTYEWIFNSDKTLDYNVVMGTLGSNNIKIGTWKVENGKLKITVEQTGYDFSTGSYDYSFTNNGSTLNLETNNVPFMTLTKK